MVDLFNPKYTTTDVSKLGIKRERLKEWMAKGFIEPSKKASGPGTKNLFTRLDLYQIKLFAYVVECGFSREDTAFRTGVFSRAQKSLRDETIPLGHDEAFFVEQKENFERGLADLASVSFLVFHNRRDQGNPALFRFMYDGEQFDPDQYKDSDYILIINFRKIRSAVDTAIS